MSNRIFLIGLLAFFSFGLFGCWEALYIPKGKTTNVGSELSKDWQKDLSTLLQKFVNDQGRVDYVGLKKEQATVNKILASIAQEDPKGWDDKQKLAFWINAYNIAMIWNILDKLEPVRKGLVTDFSDLFFKQRTFEFAGQSLSLDQLEHNVLRLQKPIENISVSKIYPEIHVAISCAAISCPPLKKTLWKAESVLDDLAKQMRVIANDPQFVSLEDGKVSITTLVDWFFDDFKKDGKTVGAFFAELINNNDALKKALTAAGNEKSNFKFKKYDWHVNIWEK